MDDMIDDTAADYRRPLEPAPGETVSAGPASAGPTLGEKVSGMSSSMSSTLARRAGKIRWLRWLAHILPDKIATRIAVTVVAAIFLTQVIGFLLIVGLRVPFMLPLRDLDHITATIAAPVLDLAKLPSADRVAAAQQISTSQVTVGWQDAYQPHWPMDDRLPAHILRDHLQRHLHGIVDLVLVEAVNAPDFMDRPPPIPLPPIFELSGPPDQHSRLWLRLLDQSWVTVEMPDSALIRFNPLHIAIWWTLSLLAILWLSLVVAKRVTRPLHNFAVAAERLGTGLDQTLLAETGPEELRHATRAFNRMQARLKRFIDDRTQMLAAISHDLRTPISRLLLRVSSLEDSDERRKMVSDLQLMDHMIGTTLDFVRDDTLAEPQQQVDLGSLIDSLVDDTVMLGGKAQYRGPAYIACACRPLAISRALGNVIDNAIKYGGSALIDLTVSSHEILITVDDDGPGIPVSAFDKVFEPFFRLDPARGPVPPSGKHAQQRDGQDINAQFSAAGSGLGLSIARNVILAHGGEIALVNRLPTSQSGAGLQVRIRLPL